MVRTASEIQRAYVLYLGYVGQKPRKILVGGKILKRSGDAVLTVSSWWVLRVVEGEVHSENCGTSSVSFQSDFNFNLYVVWRGSLN